MFSFWTRSFLARLVEKIAPVAATDGSHVRHHIGIAVRETSLKNALGTAIVGRHGEPHVAVELDQQIRQIPNPTAEVFEDRIPVADTIHIRRARHQLHEPLGILHGLRKGIPARLLLDDGVNERARNTIVVRVGVGVIHCFLILCARGRLHGDGEADGHDHVPARRSYHSLTSLPARANASHNPRNLGEVGRFVEPNTAPNAQSRWTPPPYGSENSRNQHAEKKVEDALNAPSLVFTAHEQSLISPGSENAVPFVDNLGLAPGYHVAARLESMATTAVHAPVVAVIEYNYERDGEVIIPAGARAVGKITQADPSGLVNIEFSSLEYPDGSTVPIDAVAANMNLQAVKGKVTGRQRGKNMLVRSLSGIGETAAMIVGAPSVNSSFSEDDLLRMQVANNIGNAGDEQIMRMLTLEHIVVSVPAGTEIYIVFEKSAVANTPDADKTARIPHESNGLSQSANAVGQ